MDGKGGAAPLSWETVPTGLDAAGTRIHLHLDGDRAPKWRRYESGIPDAAAEASLYEETRPRSTAIDDGHLVNLRGVN